MIQGYLYALKDVFPFQCLIKVKAGSSKDNFFAVLYKDRDSLFEVEQLGLVVVNGKKYDTVTRLKGR